MKIAKILIAVILMGYASLYAQEVSQVKITALILHTYPQYDNKGHEWDFFTAGPDIYFKITNAQGKVIYTGPVKKDITYRPEVNLFYNVNCTLPRLNETYTIAFYDKDGPFDPDDYMGGYEWTPGTDNSNYASQLRFTTASGSLSFTLRLKWCNETGK